MSHSWKNKKGNVFTEKGQIKWTAFLLVILIMTQTGETVKGTVLPHGKVSLYISFSFIFSMKIIWYSDCSLGNITCCCQEMLIAILILADAEKKENTQQKAKGKCWWSMWSLLWQYSLFSPKTVYFQLRGFFSYKIKLSSEFQH